MSGLGKVYVCECGTRLQVRQIVKNAVRICPVCKAVLPQKKLMQLYDRRRRKKVRSVRLTCTCGKRSIFPFPSGAGKCVCRRCGAELMTVKTKIIRGAAFPRYIEINNIKR